MSTPESCRNTINNDHITMSSGSTVSENSGDLDLSDEALLVIEVDSIGIAASRRKGSHSVYNFNDVSSATSYASCKGPTQLVAVNLYRHIKWAACLAPELPVYKTLNSIRPSRLHQEANSTRNSKRERKSMTGNETPKVPHRSGMARADRSLKTASIIQNFRQLCQKQVASTVPLGVEPRTVNR